MISLATGFADHQQLTDLYPCSRRVASTRGLSTGRQGQVGTMTGFFAWGPGQARVAASDRGQVGKGAFFI